MGAGTPAAVCVGSAHGGRVGPSLHGKLAVMSGSSNRSTVHQREMRLNCLAW